MIKILPFKTDTQQQVTLQHLLKTVKRHHADADLVQIKKAYTFAKERHGKQKRKTGEPYMIHPLTTAQILADMQLGENTIIGGLLHDIHEDTDTTLEEIQKKFGVHIAHIVNGVSKLKKVHITKEARQNKTEYYRNLRKMFMAMSKDIRVIIIKLADRLHNMETLEVHSPEKRLLKAKETLEIYAPIANRLGMGEIKGQLEDYAFIYTHPKKYAWLVKTFEKKFKEQRKNTTEIKRYLKQMLEGTPIKVVRIEGRAKHLYSLYRKLQSHNGDVSKVYDLIALRVIVDTLPECYQTLGIIHQEWKPLVGRIKDYIATPKPNGYQSLHTSVFALNGKITEIQIRTEKMHQEAEYGIAAHWIYADKKGIKNYIKRFLAPTPEEEIRWVQSISKWKQAKPNEREKIIELLQIDYFNDRIFVFTPTGDVRDLPLGATVLDFAYTIHKNIGNHAKTATVNDKEEPLSLELHNGDIVAIKTDKKQVPKRKWLQYTTTEQAKTHIQNYLKDQDEEEHIKQGKETLEEALLQLTGRTLSDIATTGQLKKEFQVKTKQELYQKIGDGDIDEIEIIEQLLPQPQLFPLRTILVHNQKEIERTSSIIAKQHQCCLPQPGEKIKLIDTTKEHVVIHKHNCKKAKEHKGAIAFWSKERKERFFVELDIIAENKIGLLRYVAEVLNEQSINIEHISTKKTTERYATMVALGIGVTGLRELRATIKRLKKIKGVETVHRHN